MGKPIPRIAESEWRIMKILWKKAPQTANEIIDKLNGHVEWTPKTIKTLLNRLVKKGALGFEKEGRSYLYSPVVKEKECTHEAARSFLNRVYDGTLQPMLAAFLKDEHLSPDEIAELKHILDTKGGKKNDGDN